MHFYPYTWHVPSKTNNFIKYKQILRIKIYRICFLVHHDLIFWEAISEYDCSLTFGKLVSTGPTSSGFDVFSYSFRPGSGIDVFSCSSRPGSGFCKIWYANLLLLSFGSLCSTFSGQSQGLLCSVSSLSRAETLSARWTWLWTRAAIIIVNIKLKITTLTTVKVTSAVFNDPLLLWLQEHLVYWCRFANLGASISGVLSYPLDACCLVRSSDPLPPYIWDLTSSTGVAG